MMFQVVNDGLTFDIADMMCNYIVSPYREGKGWLLTSL